jgi:hypothetical protein
MYFMLHVILRLFLILLLLKVKNMLSVTDFNISVQRNYSSFIFLVEVVLLFITFVFLPVLYHYTNSETS